MHHGQTLPSDRPAERDLNSWVQSVEENMISLAGLNIDNSPDINDLVDDKEIATRSVAFVVNSTRKGIVPLCADVANLFKAKYSLERKIHELRRDNNILKSSLSSSIASSPTSFSQRAFLQHHLPPLSRSCSRCSQCSSTASIPRQSPKLDVPRRTKPLGVKDTPFEPHKSNGYRSAGITVDQLGGLMQTDAGGSGGVNGGVNGPMEAWVARDDLPEIVSHPQCDLLKISPRQDTNRDTSVSPTDLHQQFLKSQQLNNQLSTELHSARREIETLKARLAELERNAQPPRANTNETFHIENEINREQTSSTDTTAPLIATRTENTYFANSGSTCPNVDSNRNHDKNWNVSSKPCAVLNQSAGITGVANRAGGQSHECTVTSIDRESDGVDIDETSFTSPSNVAQRPAADIPQRLPSATVDAAPSDPGASLGAPSEPRLSGDAGAEYGGDTTAGMRGSVAAERPQPMKSLVACRLLNNTRVMLGDKVSVSGVAGGDCSGLVRYLGPLDDQSHTIYAGLEMTSGGNHDGSVAGRRYFKCPKNSGVLVPLSHIVSPATQKNNESDRGSDSDPCLVVKPHATPRVTVKSPPPIAAKPAGRPREKRFRKRRTPTPDSALDTRCSLPV